MRDIRFIEREEGAREALCGRCGQQATWRFVDEEESQVEVTCPDCGRFEISKEEFDEAENDMLGSEERHE